MTSLYFKYSAMNSGKSTQLLQALYNYKERGMNAIAITAGIDDRFGAGKITARIGLASDAYIFNHDIDIFEMIEERLKAEKINVVMIDEAQFMSARHVFQAARIVDELNIPVLAYGLKTDFLGHLFEGSEALLRLADNIEEIKSICWCGKKATQTARVNESGQMVTSGQQISIGGNDKYTTLCRKHHMQRKLSDAQDAKSIKVA